jgi:hypothetical protein
LFSFKNKNREKTQHLNAVIKKRNKSFEIKEKEDEKKKTR